MDKTLVIVQTTVATYRVKLFKAIKTQLGDRLEVYCGYRFFDPTITKDKTFSPDVLLKNRFFFKNTLLWQSEFVLKSYKADIMVLSLNPRVLTNWIVLALRKLSGKRTLLWGHAWPKAGKQAKGEILRHLMRLLCNEVIVYTYTQKKELQLKMKGTVIHVAPNALYHREEMTNVHDIDPIDIIFVSRMVPNKKAMLLLRAFILSLPSIPERSKLFMIGSGPEKDKLEKIVAENKLEDRVIIPGAITNINTLSLYYKSSLVSVSPGRVGLGLIQSLAFGVPMIIAKEEMHGPEIEAAQEGFTSYYFEEDNVMDLSRKLVTIFNSKQDILSKRKQINQMCEDFYSIESMANTFVELTTN